MAELAEVQRPPPQAEHVWRYFRALHETRPSNGMSVSRIPRLDIRIWERDELIRLAHWERQAILKLDALWVKTTLEQSAA